LKGFKGPELWKLNLIRTGKHVITQISVSAIYPNINGVLCSCIETVKLLPAHGNRNIVRGLIWFYRRYVFCNAVRLLLHAYSRYF